MELHCDAPGCTAMIELVPDVPRSAHGWGRVTFYDEDPSDLDLCQTHYTAAREAIWGTTG
jgi:hypothetical protein